jgi:hypothetical protein
MTAITPIQPCESGLELAWPDADWGTWRQFVRQPCFSNNRSTRFLAALGPNCLQNVILMKLGRGII